MKFFYEHKGNQLQIEDRSKLVFPPHLHRHIELVYMLSGKVNAFAAGEEYSIEEGDFFCVFPDCVHYYDDGTEVQADVFIIPPEMIGEYREILMKKTPVSPKISGVREDVKILVKMICENKGTYSINTIKGLILAMFGMLLEYISFEEEKNMAYSTLQAILEYCENNYKNGISAASVAQALNLSRSHISHTFSGSIHLSFCDYINSLRLNEAQQFLLKSNMSMTEIASESGFETIRTFNRAFKKHYGTTPLEYRRRFTELL